MKSMTPTFKRQSGAVAIMVGLTIFVLIAFLGMTVDLGRLFITKTELSNAADACALAAAAELLGDADSLNRAVSAGKTVGTRNKVGFQGTPVTIEDDDITFSDHLDGNYYKLNDAGAIPANMKYAKCTLPQSGILPYFMQVVGLGQPNTVKSHAIATLAPGITSCAIPIAMCENKSPPPTCPDGSVPDAKGLCEKEWYCSKFTAGSSSDCSNSKASTTGNFNLVCFATKDDPDCTASTPILKDLISGSGQCTLATTGKEQTYVKGTGEKEALASALNTRFGIYSNGGGYSAKANPPDYSGFAYMSTNWPTKYDAFNGPVPSPATGAVNLTTARTNFEPYQGDKDSGLKVCPGGSCTIDNKLDKDGSNRRLVLLPIVDCGKWNSTNNSTAVPVASFACVALLHPWAGPGEAVYIEYEGLSDENGSPCAGLGLPGGPGSVGPRVPTLVR